MIFTCCMHVHTSSTLCQNTIKGIRLFQEFYLVRSKYNKCSYNYSDSDDTNKSTITQILQKSIIVMSHPITMVLWSVCRLYICEMGFRSRGGGGWIPRVVVVRRTVENKWIATYYNYEEVFNDE